MIVQIDTDVKRDEIYEYSAILYYLDGKTTTGSGRSVQKYVPITTEVGIEIQNFRLTRGKNPNVTFTIDGGGKTSDTSLLLDALKKDNIDNLFSDETSMSEFKEKAADIIVFMIQRANLTEGIEEAFSLEMGSGVFSDRKMSIQSRMLPLQAGNRYRYTIRAYKLKASQIFESYSSVRSDPRSNFEYNFDSSKFDGNHNLYHGTLRTANSRKLKKSSVFLEGETGSFVNVDVDLTAVLPGISTANVTALNSHENLITWSIDGDKSKIDHFIIIGSKLNESVPIGVVHPSEFLGKFDYVDSVMTRMPGVVSYSILPVYLDYSLGSLVMAGSIKIIKD